MARTDYGAILSTVIKDTSDSIREVNKTSALIAPSAWGTQIRTMVSADDYQDALDNLPVNEIAKTPIATFSDGASNVPFKEIVAYIQATQDLHGQSAPYPAGGGKNLYNKNGKNTSNGYVNGYYLYDDGEEKSNANYEISEYIAVNAGTDYTVQGLQGDRVFLCYYDSSKVYLGQQRYSAQATRTVTTPANTAYIRLSVYIANEDTTQLEAGSTATSYAPYENICPITGRTSVSVTHTGKNIVNIADQTFTRNKTLTCNFPKGTYTVSAVVTSNDTDASTCLIYFRNKDNVAIAHAFLGRNTRSSANITFDEDVGYIYLYASDTNSHSQGDTATWADIQIEVGSTATSYAPYTGQTVTINLNGTYYGGYVNLDTGVFTATHIYYNLADLTYTTTSWGAYRSTTLSDDLKYASPSEAMCDIYNYVTYTVLNQQKPNNSFALSSNYIYVLADTSPVGNVCYKLLNPRTYQLSRTQLRQIAGTNNVFCSTGDVAVKYYATESTGGVEYLYDDTTLIDGKYIDTDGVEKSYSGWSCTDYIEVTGGEVLGSAMYTCRNYNAFYDENKDFISYFKPDNVGYCPITVPQTAHYMRMSNYTGDIQKSRVWRE